MGFFLKAGRALGDGHVELAHVGGVMLVVMNHHRLGVDKGLEAHPVVVTERREA